MVLFGGLAMSGAPARVAGPMRAPLLLAPGMDRLTDPFSELAQILAPSFAIGELFGALLGVCAEITDSELYAP